MRHRISFLITYVHSYLVNLYKTHSLWYFQKILNIYVIYLKYLNSIIFPSIKNQEKNECLKCDNRRIIRYPKFISNVIDIFSLVNLICINSIYYLLPLPLKLPNENKF